VSAAKVPVGINMLWCVPGVGGSEEYLVRQLDGLSRLGETGFAPTVFAPRGFARRHPELPGRFPLVEAPSDCARRPVRLALERTWLPRAASEMSLMHHGGGTVPAGGSRPTVLTIHDVQWCEYPGYFSPLKLRWLRRAVPSSLRRATRIAVPSEFVAGTLVKYFATQPARIDVVRHGLEPRAGRSPTPENELRERLGLGGRRVLVYPAITHPHKNHRFLLDLMCRPGPWSSPDLVVVFAGGAGRADDDVTRRIAAGNLGDRVVRPGRVSEADRDGLLAMAEAMVFPSEYEGFGAPLIEAMRSGTPVICSDKGSLPAVAGDACLVLPLEAEAWSGALDRVRARRREMSEAGLRRAEAFTSELSARDLVAVYEKAMR